MVSAFFAVLLIAPISLHAANADTWYPGEGLKQGDYYRYNVCWTDWHNCSPLEIDLWVKNQTSDGNGWNLEMLAIDGSNMQKGIVTIGMITPDPTYSDPNISDYSNIFKNTISWLDAFSTKVSQQTLGSPSWGRTGSVGGQNVATTGKASITVQGGTFNTWILGWHKGIDNQIWIAPELAFPVKAIVYTDVTSGVPPPDYTLELLETGNSKTEPKFLQVSSSGIIGVNPKCQQSDMVQDFVHDSVTTDSGQVIIEYRYSPSNPHNGCPVEMRLSFEKQFDQSQKYSNIQYDIFTVDDQGHQLDSVAQDLGKSALFAPVGDDDITINLKGTPPMTHMIINVLGSGQEGSAPDPSLSGFSKIEIKTQEPFSSPSGGTPQPIVIPSWIKNNAKWWHDGSIGDNDFVKGIQYMIQKGIMKIPTTQPGSSTSQKIPAWVKNNAGLWGSNQIDDLTFVQGIQYLISNGIIVITS